MSPPPKGRKPKDFIFFLVRNRRFGHHGCMERLDFSTFLVLRYGSVHESMATTFRVVKSPQFKTVAIGLLLLDTQ